ncbi:MAG: class I SAM-dependent methyltransferase [Deltaproteobacteria bacterium]|nr:class I SAM-dependent methyltransferase [Deltaproteobacteria bacterium]
MKNTVDAVRAFWDARPLLVGEIEQPVGTRAWFEEFDRIKTNDGFCGDLTGWVPLDVDNKRILDLGCGPGYWNRLFGKLNVEYYGIDISPKTVELAELSQQLYGLPGQIAVGNAEQIDFPDEYFDYVVSEGVIHHTPDTQGCIDEIYRVLVPSGQAAIGVYYRNFIFRAPVLFRQVLGAMRFFKISMKGRGREKMAWADTPEDFVRMFDGADNPIGKAYTKEQLRHMFRHFSEIRFARYCLPLRMVKDNIPNYLHKLIASRFGLMILAKVKK